MRLDFSIGRFDDYLSSVDSFEIAVPVCVCMGESLAHALVVGCLARSLVTSVAHHWRNINTKRMAYREDCGWLRGVYRGEMMFIIARRLVRARGRSLSFVFTRDKSHTHTLKTTVTTTTTFTYDLFPSDPYIYSPRIFLLSFFFFPFQLFIYLFIYYWAPYYPV